MLDKDTKKFTLWVLAWPIFIELFLQFLLGAVDTLMVSRISDDAVAVVGFSNQLFQAMTTLFMTVASGAGILIAQKIGSYKTGDARTIGIMAVSVTTLIGLVCSVILFAMPEAIASMLQLPDRLLPLAGTYISIVGGGMVLIAMMATMSTVIRNTGNTRGPMYVAIGMNVIHVIMNYGFIFGAFGFPQWGLTGVAISTVASRLLAVLMLLYMFLRAFEYKIKWKEFRVFDRPLFGEILKIGWPLGINMSCWVFSQLVIYSFIAQLGAAELAARTYMNTLESFCFLLGSSIAMAAQIQIAHLYGAGRTREAYRSAYRALGIGAIYVIVNAFVLYVFGKQLLGLFTDDKTIIAIGASLLGMNLILQPGKMLNMALGNSLNAVGDTRFTMYISLGSMWIVATVLSYVLGIYMGWGLIGIYSCMIADEYLRGVLSYFRWRGQKCLRKAESQAPADSVKMPGESVAAAGV
ncbi:MULTISPECIES: MATE family efflux transporter [Paenibacillus]|jgi:putative MATE family efflux protein|uniref:MATE efflux family protein n=2 Tax=Paenibacillus lactis TaxID=228574 RepID=G4HHD8_9BACL|nr:MULTISPECIES: MATE family efflux transporter [Paenibacillus]EHB63514.1 MATE efflux family protein [Paenibacillus lactis 154]MBP1891796.1 putative MATE family efflux protein [Paenibacillus lactis]MCM3494253.1 MATE family efflux transporter [Paenibacillus lactis]HAF99243.1 MATE family efflux transporter [Paenibacillus lactis]